MQPRIDHGPYQVPTDAPNAGRTQNFTRFRIHDFALQFAVHAPHVHHFWPRVRRVPRRLLSLPLGQLRRSLLHELRRGLNNSGNGLLNFTDDLRLRRRNFLAIGLRLARRPLDLFFLSVYLRLFDD